MMVLDGQTSIFDLLQTEKPAQPVTIDGVGTLNDPGDFEAMHEARLEHFRIHSVDKGNWRPYRGWAAHTHSGKGSAHEATCFDAELRCTHHGRRGECQCVGSLTYRVYCHGCEEWLSIHETANDAWEAYLDHCWPGWRDLPVVETSTRGYSYVYHWPKNYPEAWKIPGAPVRDCRGLTKYATRHVPGGSPFDGIKVAVIQECAKHKPDGEK